MNTCQICSYKAEHPIWIAREMMFGMQEEFEYFECNRCECLQISSFPANIERYYPSNYYSFSRPPSYSKFTQRFHCFWSARSPLSKLVNKFLFSKYELYAKQPSWLVENKLGLARETEILDVGCGTGQFLCELAGLLRATNLTGADPYIKEDIYYENGVKIYKLNLEEIKHQYDVIMLHHSFEHMAEPQKVLNELHRLLKSQGRLLIRIPITSSFAWKKYRENWVQLDAPRHFFLHSIYSLRMLAEGAGFSIESIEYDSTAFQFWGSEQYKKNIPLLDNRSYAVNPKNSVFTTKQIVQFTREAQFLNQNQTGDQACFYLRKS